MEPDAKAWKDSAEGTSVISDEDSRPSMREMVVQIGVSIVRGSAHLNGQ